MPPSTSWQCRSKCTMPGQHRAPHARKGSTVDDWPPLTILGCGKKQDEEVQTVGSQQFNATNWEPGMSYPARCTGPRHPMDWQYLGALTPRCRTGFALSHQISVLPFTNNRPHGRIGLGSVV